MSGDKTRHQTVIDPTRLPSPFDLRTQLVRVLWGMTWLLLARFTPPQLHRWRAFLLRLFGAKIGSGTRVYASAQIWLPSTLRIGENSIIGPRVRLYNQGEITIGDGCVISQGAHICASTHRISDPDFPLEKRSIAIGSGCWIAAEAFVGPGVTMEPGSVLAARGALFADAGEMGIYRGNPAERIGTRTLINAAD